MEKLRMQLEKLGFRHYYSADEPSSVELQRVLNGFPEIPGMEKMETKMQFVKTFRKKNVEKLAELADKDREKIIDAVDTFGTRTGRLTECSMNISAEQEKAKVFKGLLLEGIVHPKGAEKLIEKLKLWERN